jgi:hypothetical protein
MFTRADVLWLLEKERTFPLHAVDFSWDGFEPSLTCRDVQTGDVSEFDLHDVRFLVSRRRTCVGYFEGDVHVPCADGTEDPGLAQCPDCCGESVVPIQQCLFEPRCEGELCDSPLCRREHVLYLAFYGTDVKIGMSSSRRVERRLVEQGADAFSMIGSFPNRMTARAKEKEISSALRIPQSYRQERLIEGLARRVDASAVDVRLDGLRSALSQRFGLDAGRLVMLDRYPIDLPLPSAPRLQETPGQHKGVFVGMKGKWLVYEDRGLRALSLSDLPSRYLTRM